MDEVIYDEKSGFFSRFSNIFQRGQSETDVEETIPVRNLAMRHDLGGSVRSTTVVRKQITSIADAEAAGHGLKRGEQQILNLTSTDPQTRHNIVQFMYGVVFSEEAVWEEIGANIYLVAPAGIYVEVAPASPRLSAMRN